MLWLVLLKIKLARMAFANRRAYSLCQKGVLVQSQVGLRTWVEISSCSSLGKLMK